MKFVKVTEINEKYPSSIDIYRGVVLSKDKNHITVCGTSNKDDDIEIYTISLKNHSVRSIKRDEFELRFNQSMIKLQEAKLKAETELKECENNLRFAELKKKEWFK